MTMDDKDGENLSPDGKSWHRELSSPMQRNYSESPDDEVLIDKNEDNNPYHTDID